MDLPSFDNAEKWFSCFKKTSFSGKFIIITLVISFFLGYLLLNEILRIPNLNEKYANLDEEKTDLATRKDEIIKQKNDELDSIRNENSKLYSENLHLKEINDPIRRKAEQLYPNLEMNAAITQLIRDIENVEYLATKNDFRPLNDDMMKAFRESIDKFMTKYKNRKPEIVISYQVGNKNRAIVSKYLADTLSDFGLTVSFEGTVTMEYSGEEPTIETEYNEGNQEYCIDFCKSIYTYINTKYSIISRQRRLKSDESLNKFFNKEHIFGKEKLDRAHLSNETFMREYKKDLNDILELIIIGNPEFIPTGVVIMR